MKSRFEHLLVALVFALLAAGLTLAFAEAKSSPPVIAQDQTPVPGTPAPEVMPTQNITYDNCVSCHQDMQDSWIHGPHGQAFSDPVFTASWNTQGQPGACLVCHTTGYDPTTGKSNAQSVSCEACHSPIPANHPKDNMPIDSSPDLCGKCHSDPRFSTTNWKLSAHYQREMTCTVCHDPHTAGMKSVQGAVNTIDASDLCENCHKDAMKNFPASKHAEAGVTCVNCHLGFNVGNSTDASNVDFATAHKAPDHSFMPTLDTCNKCHANQMHAPGESVAAAAIRAEEVGGTPTPEPTAVVTPVPPITDQPTPVSPIGFAGMAGLIGLAGGMVLAPWLERLYRQILKESKHGSN